MTGSASAAGSSTAATAVPEQADVTLIMDWVPWVLDIPVDVAQEQGFYADHGLTVHQQVPGRGHRRGQVRLHRQGAVRPVLRAGHLMGVAEGAPLLSVAALMSHAPVGMALAPGVHAKAPADLAGTTAGVVMVPSTRASFETMLKTGGVDPSSVKVVDPGFDLVPPLLAGRYDWVSVTEFGELVQADQTGQKLDYLDFRDWGTPDYAFLNVLTQKGFAEKDPNTVRAFVAATTEGLDWAIAHPAEAVALYVKRHPELDAGLLLAQWKAATPSMAAAGDGHPSGWQDVATWTQLNDWMVQTGLIEGAGGRVRRRHRRLPPGAVSLAAEVSVDGLAAGYGDPGRRGPRRRPEPAALELVLDGVEFDLPAGDCLAVVGRSGCGKSTLLHVLAGLLAPSEGTVRAGGRVVAGADWEGRGGPGCSAGHAAYMFQRDLLLPWKSALHNAVFPARMAARSEGSGHGGRRGEAARAAADLERRGRGLLEEFGLGDALDATPGELSGGMRQRVALARTMLMDRGLILLDEPFGSLDAVTRAEMRRWLLGVMVAHPATWVLVTHDVEEAVLLGDHVAVLHGRPARLEGWRRADLDRAARMRLAAAAEGDGLEDAADARALASATVAVRRLLRPV